MASTYTSNTGIEKIGAGEQAGTWGTTTNTNLDIIDRALNGVGSISLSGTTHNLTTSDGALSEGGFRVLVFTGALGANNTVSILPNDADKLYLVVNSTTDSGSSGPYSVILSQGSGADATIANGETAWVYADGGGGSAIVKKVSTDLVNDTTPQLGGNLDVNGKLIKFGDAATAGDDDTLEFGADDDMQLYHDGTDSYITNKTGALKIATETTDIAITIGHTSSEVTVADNLTVTGTLKEGSVPVKVSGKETIWVPASAMYPNTTNGCARLTQVELSNGPELKVLDFDKDSDENAQFSVAFPKSWQANAGTTAGPVTFQAFFTATSTDTGTVAWGLSAVAVADNDTCDVAFGTNVVATAKAHSGTSNDINVTAESGDVTIAGAPAADELVFFQIMRDTSADSLAADARLLGIKLFFTTDKKNDA